MNWNVKRFSMLNISQVVLMRTDSNLCRKELTVHWSAPNSLIRSYLQPCTNSMWGMKVKLWLPLSDYTRLWMPKRRKFSFQNFSYLSGVMQMATNKSSPRLQIRHNSSGLLLTGWKWLHLILVTFNTLCLVEFSIQWCGAPQWTHWHSYLEQLFCSCMAS